MARKTKSGPDKISIPSLAPEVRAAIMTVRLDPALFARAMQTILARRGKGGDLLACTDAYCGFHGISRDEAMTPKAVSEMAALVWRVTALADALDANVVSPADAEDHAFALFDAASNVRLVDGKAGPTFQPLEFLAAFERAKATS